VAASPVKSFFYAAEIISYAVNTVYPDRESLKALFLKPAAVSGTDNGNTGFVT